MTLTTFLPFASSLFAALFLLVTPFTKNHTIAKWVFAIGMLALAIEQLFAGLTFLTNNPIEIASHQQNRFITTSFLPGIWLLFSAIYSRGDVWRAVKRRAIFIVPAFLIPISLALFTPKGLLLLARDETRPFQWVVTLGGSGFLIHVAMLISMIGALVCLERTYQASVGTLRWKIKFMLYGLGTLFAARFYTSSQTVLTQQIDPALDIINATALLLACLLIGRSLMRPGSFDIDLYPSQSIISGSLTITLAGTYLIVVGILSKIVTWMGGESAYVLNTFLILVAVVSLGLTLQSDRFKQKLKRFVSRNFQRPLFDYRTVWLKVNEATSVGVRRKQICQSSARLLADLFDVKLVSVWILNTADSRFVLAASTDLKSDQSIQDESRFFPSTGIAENLRDRADPFDLDKLNKTWAEPIKTNNPKSFKEGGNRICIPLVKRSNVVGIIILGDRTNQLDFTQQEFDTLACISNHLAASLLNAELTRKLTEAKEVEAFQTMATFFVHDLKNAVSTLNLMLKNMPNHWDNPEFREDALRGLGNTSERITQLITRLGNVRGELEIAPSMESLDRLLDKTINLWKRPEGVTFSRESSGDLMLKIDVDKIQSVILNLLINACEAMEGNGSIRLKTTSDASFSYIHISDTGPGMSDEFIRKSLFRPFKTTKKNGLGIGMFQSKMVVEAHRGSINVKSVKGTGTTFTVKLPLPEDLKLAAN